MGATKYTFYIYFVGIDQIAEPAFIRKDLLTLGPDDANHRICFKWSRVNSVYASFDIEQKTWVCFCCWHSIIFFRPGLFGLRVWERLQEMRREEYLLSNNEH